MSPLVIRVIACIFYALIAMTVGLINNSALSLTAIMIMIILCTVSFCANDASIIHGESPHYRRDLLYNAGVITPLYHERSDTPNTPYPITYFVVVILGTVMSLVFTFLCVSITRSCFFLISFLALWSIGAEIRKYYIGDNSDGFAWSDFAITLGISYGSGVLAFGITALIYFLFGLIPGVEDFKFAEISGIWGYLSVPLFGALFNIVDEVVFDEAKEDDYDEASSTPAKVLKAILPCPYSGARFLAYMGCAAPVVISAIFSAI